MNDSLLLLLSLVQQLLLSPSKDGRFNHDHLSWDFISWHVHGHVLRVPPSVHLQFSSMPGTGSGVPQPTSGDTLFHDAATITRTTQCDLLCLLRQRQQLELG